MWEPPRICLLSMPMHKDSYTHVFGSGYPMRPVVTTKQEISGSGQSMAAYAIEILIIQFVHKTRQVILLRVAQVH